MVDINMFSIKMQTHRLLSKDSTLYSTTVVLDVSTKAEEIEFKVRHIFPLLWRLSVFGGVGHFPT